MIVAFDNTFLSIAFNPGSPPRPDPSTGVPIPHCALRVEAMIDAHSKRGDTVLIPTPCLSEMLCAVPDIEKAISTINKSVAFDLAAFDARCAVDLADAIRRAVAAGDKKSGIGAGWQEIKFDRQIAVIAKVGGAEVFYSDDSTQSKFAKMLGMSVKHTWDLDLPSEFAQIDGLDQMT